MIQRNVIWKPVVGVGLEQLSLLETPDGYVVDSFILFVDDEKPVRLWYRIQIDRDWRVQSFSVYSTTSARETAELPIDLHGPSVALDTDGAGNWTNRCGQPERSFDGCIDIDISMTPFTNTLPIRRLNLEAGESAEIPVVYIDAPTLEVSSAPQRYTCLELYNTGALYRFEGLDSGFTAEIPVDEDGLVLDYPGLFERVS